MIARGGRCPRVVNQTPNHLVLVNWKVPPRVISDFSQVHFLEASVQLCSYKNFLGFITIQNIAVELSLLYDSFATSKTRPGEVPVEGVISTKRWVKFRALGGRDEGRILIAR